VPVTLCMERGSMSLFLPVCGVCGLLLFLSCRCQYHCAWSVWAVAPKWAVPPLILLCVECACTYPHRIILYIFNGTVQEQAFGCCVIKCLNS